MGETHPDDRLSMTTVSVSPCCIGDCKPDDSLVGELLVSVKFWSEKPACFSEVTSGNMVHSPEWHDIF